MGLSTPCHLLMRSPKASFKGRFNLGKSSNQLRVQLDNKNQTSNLKNSLPALVVWFSGDIFNFCVHVTWKLTLKIILNGVFQKSVGWWQHQWKKFGVANKISLRNYPHFTYTFWCAWLNKKKKKAYWFVTTVTYHINCSTEILLKMNCLTLFYKESARTHCEGSCYIDFSFSAKVIIATFTRKLWGPVIKSKLRLVRINEQRTCGDEATSIDLCYNSSLPFNSAILGEAQQLPAARHRHTDTEPNLYWDKFSVWKPARRYWTDFL